MSLPVADDSQAELLRSYVDYERRRKEAAREAVRTALMAEGSPTSPELTARIAQLPFTDAAEVLRSHTGYVLSEGLQSYRLSISIFDQATTDLVEAIDRFQDLVRRGDFDRRNMGGTSALERTVQKELFAATASAHSAVDHTRRLRSLVEIPDYQRWLQEVFGGDGMHEFVIWLRTILHHVHVLPAGWQTRRAFAGAPEDATFTLDRRELIDRLSASDRLAAGQREKIDRFLRAGPDAIDLRVLFVQYAVRVSAFSSRLLAFVDGDPITESVRDLERVRREGRNHNARLMWAALIGNWLNWDRPPNPYNHLPRFLSDEQLATINALEAGSPEQINLVIEFLDEGQACDDRLREMIHRYFAKAIAVHGASVTSTQM